EAHRTVMLARSLEGIEQRRQVVAAEIAHECCKFFVAAALDQTRDVALVANVVEQTLAPGSTALEGQRRIELVRAGVDPLAQLLASELGKGRLLQLAVLENDDVPTEIAEDRLEARPQALAHHRIEALAVVVNHPPRVTQAVLPALQ